MNDQTGSELQIDVLEIARAIWKNILVVILVVLICGGVAFEYSYLTFEPTYSADILVYINTSAVKIGTSNFSVMTGSNLSTTYMTLLKSRTTLQEIIDTSGLQDYDIEKLSDSVSASTGEDKDTSFIRIRVTTPNPQESEIIANTIAEVLPRRVSDIIEGSTMKIVDYAVVPSGRNGGGYLKSTAIGALIGAVIVCGIIAVRCIIDQQRDPLIYSADDLVSMYPDVPLLGSVMDMRFGNTKVYSGRYGAYGKNYYTNYYTSKSEKSTKEA